VPGVIIWNPSLWKVIKKQKSIPELYRCEWAKSSGTVRNHIFEPPEKLCQSATEFFLVRNFFRLLFFSPSTIHPGTNCDVVAGRPYMRGIRMCFTAIGSESSQSEIGDSIKRDVNKKASPSAGTRKFSVSISSRPVEPSPVIANYPAIAPNLFYRHGLRPSRSSFVLSKRSLSVEISTAHLEGTNAYCACFNLQLGVRYARWVWAP
jgi:hypothetical protein